MGGKLKKPRRASLRQPSAWQKSLAFRFMASEAIKAYNRTRHLQPQCGAHSKSTDAPCKQIALANGRCYLHGGKTPKGEEWGRMQITAKPRSRQAASDWRKVEEKLKRHQQEEAGRRRRLLAMSEDEFVAYVRRVGRRFSAAMQKLVNEEKRRRGLSTPPRHRAAAAPANPELDVIHAQIDALKKRKADLEQQPINEGVFA